MCIMYRTPKTNGENMNKKGIIKTNQIQKGRHRKPFVIYVPLKYAAKSIPMMEKYLSRNKCKALEKQFKERQSRNPYSLPALEKAIEYAAENKANLIAANMGRRLRNTKVMTLLITAAARNIKFFHFDTTFKNATIMDPETLVTISAQYVADLSETVKERMKKMKKTGYTDKYGNLRYSFGLHSEEDLRKAGEGGARVHRENYIRFAREIQPEIEAIEKEGHTTLAAIASELNRKEIPSRYGKAWHPSSVRTIKIKIGELS